MSRDSQTVEELVTEAERFENAGELNNALERWRLAVTLQQDPIMLCRLGRIATDLGQWDEAERALRSAIGLAPELAIGYECLGLLYDQQDQLELAVDNYNQSLRIEQNARRFTLLGIAQLHLDLNTAARESFAKALTLDPNYEEACYNLALTIRDQAPTEAIDLLRKAVEIDGMYSIAHRELGWLLRRSHQHLDAEYHIQRAIELDASDGWAHIYLGNLLWRKRDVPSAEQAFLKAIEVWPDDSTPFWCLAIFYEYTDRPREADLFYEKALQLNPDDDQANLRFGLYLKETGDTARAKTYLERALTLDPENERAISALAELDDSAVSTGDSHKPS